MSATLIGPRRCRMCDGWRREDVTCAEAAEGEDAMARELLQVDAILRTMGGTCE